MTRTRSSLRLTLAGAMVALAALGVAGCSSTAAESSSSTSPATIQTAGATIIDVRTPQEYADGHLEGATNIDVSAPTFATAIATLPKSGSYVVYCRSGNRSATATQEMTAAGFTNVTDAGGLQEAEAATGLPVVSGS